MDAAASSSHATTWGDEEVRNCSVSQRDLNFGGTVVGQCEDDGDDGYRRRVSRDPMSHRIIEKRRRDRMNSCLADLSRLIPAEYLKRGRGRIEKTEIIEMAIRHMRHLQESQQPFLPLGHPTPPLTTSSSSSSPGSCSSSPVITSMSNHQEVCELADENGGAVNRNGASVSLGKETSSSDQYRLGFLECLSEALHFLIEVEGFPAGGSLCLSLDAHLRNHCSAMLQGGTLPSTKTEYTLDEENHFQMEMSQRKSLELPGLDVPASEGEDLESVAKGTECRDCEAYRPSELRVMLTRKEQEQNSGGEPSILSLQPALEDSGGGGASYKFKSNIKRRFTAGLEKRRKFEESEGKKCSSEGRDESQSITMTAITNSTTHFLVPPHPSNAVQLSPHSVAPGSPTVPHSPQLETLAPHRIPVFALHSEHAFYVPLMLDPDALAPHASLLSKHASALHPVTISVNFCSNNGGGVDECGEQRHNGSPLPISRDYSCSTPLSAMAESASKHNYRHWRSSEGYLSQ